MQKKCVERYYEGERPEMLPFVPLDAARILEIGCANGRFGASIKKRQKTEIWGVEIVPEAAQKAATRLDKVIQGDIYGSMDQLPESYFDCIICNDILEHIPDPEVILEKLNRHIVPGGVVVASIPNIRYLPVLFELLVMRDFRYRDWGVLDNTHLRFFTRKSIYRLFRKAGYEIFKIQGLEIPLPLFQMFIIWLTTILTLGFYNDTRFIQFACVARHRQET